MPDQIVVSNVFASQSGNVPVSQLDTDLTAVAKQLGVYAVRNLVGANNAGTPNTKFDYSADGVVLRNPTTFQTAVVMNTGTLTNDTAVAGSTANGRDQAGAFGASNFIHFYFIWNGSTLSTLSSLTAPPTGPTLPTGYTHWAYAGAVYYNATPLLVKTRMRGSWMFYETPVSALSGGAAAVETAISLTTTVPPNALAFKGHTRFVGNTAASGVISATLDYRVITGSNFLELQLIGTFQAVVATYINGYQQFEAPNQGQNLYYIITVTTGSSITTDLNIAGYSVPNGGA